eukprot:CAMPEP_0198324644 /NCGR_PEP_ID=MMETSP1450-20131203/12613_1 /TAXON_ID=753684 ORGANISM="Madagascaria erythrocladiodes, Strain CCMP3234" /NCGR_SAMPLE_ID=MMETSP1450 /ASSEMBLY_ACC=CAM_ASM_001115 /LENGTH=35 /DNA_ID= /DNA_START= /DNA_END= /DNA_ORIENTATION=
MAELRAAVRELEQVRRRAVGGAREQHDDRVGVGDE